MGTKLGTVATNDLVGRMMFFDGLPWTTLCMVYWN